MNVQIIFNETRYSMRKTMLTYCCIVLFHAFTTVALHKSALIYQLAFKELISFNFCIKAIPLLSFRQSNKYCTWRQQPVHGQYVRGNVLIRFRDSADKHTSAVDAHNGLC